MRLKELAVHSNRELLNSVDQK